MPTYSFTKIEGDVNEDYEKELSEPFTRDLRVACCPFESRCVIAEVVLRAIEAFESMHDRSVPSIYLCKVCPSMFDITQEYIDRAKDLYMEDLAKVKKAFELLLDEDTDLSFDEGAFREYEDGMLLFAQILPTLWI